MKRKIIAVLMIICLTVLSGCSTKNVGDETTEPLDKLINGIINKNVSVYKSAFPPDYIEQVESAFKKVGNDVDQVLKENFSSANDVNEANYGKNVKINYKLISKEKMSQDDLNEKYWDIFINSYYLPVGNISEAYKETVEITIKGADSDTTKNAVYKFLKINGTWYIHPQSFMYVFSV